MELAQIYIIIDLVIAFVMIYVVGIINPLKPSLCSPFQPYCLDIFFFVSWV